LTYNGSDLTLPEGNYNSQTLPTALKTLLDGEGVDTYTVTISNITAKLTITSDTTTAFTLAFPDGLNIILGFEANPLLAASYTGVNVIQPTIVSVGIDFIGTAYLNVTSMVTDSVGSTVYIPFSKSVRFILCFFRSRVTTIFGFQ
jgi:hypothetical protein